MQYNILNFLKKIHHNYIKKSKGYLYLLFMALISTILSACISVHEKIDIPTVNNTAQISKWSSINGWVEDDIRQAWPAWLASCEKLKFKPEWSKVCYMATSIPNNDINIQREYFENNFTIQQLQGVNSKLTGYYEPILIGAKNKNNKFLYPIYSYPQEWKKNKPLVMPTREQIMQNNLLHGNELFYLDNPVDVAFLHVQGSGQLVLEDGMVARVAYAANNGYQFKSFAQYMINQGYITRSQASIAGIKKWAANNPDKISQVLNSNPRFIFFSHDPSQNTINSNNNYTSAVGALGVKLTPQRSIAVDTNYITLGSPVFIQSTNPNGSNLNRLVMAQDIGNAIKGQVRADYFWGSGMQAGENAGKTNYPLNMWVLHPKM